MQAIVLAAGCGSRLLPLTSEVPKCLVPVLGRPLLATLLESLERLGVTRTVVVLGYRSERVLSAFGDRAGPMQVDYVLNRSFASTNNVVSLWLACAEVTDDVLLLESDLLLDQSLLEDLSSASGEAVALVDDYDAGNPGTVVIARGSYAQAIVPASRQGNGFDYRRAHKTVNAYKLTREFLVERYAPALERTIADGNTDQFYEETLGELVHSSRARVGLLRVAGRRWAEIDTIADLHRAEALFDTDLATAG